MNVFLKKMAEKFGTLKISAYFCIAFQEKDIHGAYSSVG